MNFKTFYYLISILNVEQDVDVEPAVCTNLLSRVELIETLGAYANSLGFALRKFTVVLKINSFQDEVSVMSQPSLEFLEKLTGDKFQNLTQQRP